MGFLAGGFLLQSVWKRIGVSGKEGNKMISLACAFPGGARMILNEEGKHRLTARTQKTAYASIYLTAYCLGVLKNFKPSVVLDCNGPKCLAETNTNHR